MAPFSAVSDARAVYAEREECVVGNRCCDCAELGKDIRARLVESADTEMKTKIEHGFVGRPSDLRGNEVSGTLCEGWSYDVNKSGSGVHPRVMELVSSSTVRACVLLKVRGRRFHSVRH